MVLGPPVRSHTSSFLWVCSTTTIDASTSAPIAMAIPPSDMMFADTPNARNGMNEINTATGIVTTGIIALGMCHRNSMMTTTTVIMISTSVELQVVDGAPG